MNRSAVLGDENKGMKKTIRPSTRSLVQHQSSGQPGVSRRGSIVDGVWTPSFDQPDFSNEFYPTAGNEEDESLYIHSSLTESSRTPRNSAFCLNVNQVINLVSRTGVQQRELGWLSQLRIHRRVERNSLKISPGNKFANISIPKKLEMH